MTLQILLIEHDEVDGLYPFASTHCSWEIRTGAYTILERWGRALPTASVTVHTHRTLHLESFLERHRDTPSFQAVPTLIMSGHVLTSPSVMRQIAETCAASDTPILFFCNGSAVGAYLTASPASPEESRILLEAIDIDACRTIEITGHLLNRLWHALDHIDELIRWDAGLIGDHIDEDAAVHSSAIIDHTHGPVLILEGAHVGAHTVITGPAVIGHHATVKPLTSIAHSVIGPHSKVAGEISVSIVQGYANKQHDGFLGHSYLNEWTNLGAGTITSNLKNTYGHIHVQLPWGEEDTQRMFVGLLMGAHSKSGIGTRFSTGTVCGISLPTNAPYEIDKAIHVARSVMARRLIDLGPATEALYRHEAGNHHG